MGELVGLKFPFTINAKGGMTLVKQSKGDTSLMDFKLEQLLNTNRGERVMECDVFSDLDTFVFEPSDVSTRTLLEYEIRQAIVDFIPEITIINISVYSQGRQLIAAITYRDNTYNSTETSVVKVGDLS